MSINAKFQNIVQQIKKYNSIEEEEKRIDKAIEIAEKRNKLEEKRKKLIELQKQVGSTKPTFGISVGDINKSLGVLDNKQKV